MYLKHYKIYTRLALSGIFMAMLPSLTLWLLDSVLGWDTRHIYGDEYEILAVVFFWTSVLLFAIAMCSYFAIINVLTTVTTITQSQKRISFLTHILSFIGLILFGMKFIFDWNIFLPQVLLISSIIIRSTFGIGEIDGQMKSLCKELDKELFKIGYENLSEEEKTAYTEHL